MKNINFHFENTHRFKMNRIGLRKCIFGIIMSEGKKCNEIDIIFCNDDLLLQVNQNYLDHDYFTDIITFDYTDKNMIAGDLFISVDRVNENAKQFGVSFENELYRVIFHGILHLTGYTDKTTGEKAIMTEKENYYLEIAGF